MKIKLRKIKLVRNSEPREYIDFIPTDIRSINIADSNIKIISEEVNREEFNLCRKNIYYSDWRDNIRLLETYFENIKYIEEK